MARWPIPPNRDRREHALVDAIADDCAAARRVIAAQEAQVMRCLVDAWALAQEQTSRISSADSRKRDMPLRDISARVAAELHLNDRSVQSRMYDAWRLVTRFPATFVALEQGRISKQHADALADVGAAFEADDVRQAFEEVVLAWAEAETVGRTRAYARQLAEKLNPRTMAERHEDAADERSITIVDLDNGMSQIIALVPTVYAHAVRDRLTQQAAHVKKAAARERAARRASGWRDENEADAGAHGNGREAKAAVPTTAVSTTSAPPTTSAPICSPTCSSPRSPRSTRPTGTSPGVSAPFARRCRSRCRSPH